MATVQAFVGGELVARAAENITTDQVVELTRIQDELEQAYQHTDVDRMVQLNHEFHRLINVAADSLKLTQFMSGITRYAPESVLPPLEGGQSRPPETIAPLKRGDGMAARVAMAEHFVVGVEPVNYTFDLAECCHHPDWQATDARSVQQPFTTLLGATPFAAGSARPRTRV
ncbi:hypothetical protein A5630_11740 [Mycolicibacterium mucogenicum]|uniref:GntR C-terminal domain-containing protein n=1 Tax=Mycolicibacterium mucogenicum TaxID=56689 RepID=A0A1A3HFK7_MYCMU|nr:FCD domain-containing protein [Mycolicibacterium mucogenicum]OBJ46393.1 hypothetical protein A5630_11740 [Mycolicibacterium mucogenicum]